MRGLFDRDWRKVLIILLTILAAAAAVWVVWLIVQPILRTVVVFLFAAVVAFGLAGPVSALGTRLGSRLAAIGVVYLLLGVLLLGGAALLSGPFVAQLSALGSDLPEHMETLQSRAPEVEGVSGDMASPQRLRT